MLKGIPDILSPELLRVLMEMGHGDELVLADGNFPCFAHPARVVRADGHAIPQLMEAILTLMPLDGYAAEPVTHMEVPPEDPYVPEIWDTYEAILNPQLPPGSRIGALEKTTFYERAKQAYAVVTTSEKALYANIILRKGVV